MCEFTNQLCKQACLCRTGWTEEDYTLKVFSRQESPFTKILEENIEITKCKFNHA